MFTKARKMTSGSSSSENTPLLNGSHEGPCYAYSYANSREDEEEEEEEHLGDSIQEADLNKNKYLPFLQNLKTSIFVLIIIFCSICVSFVKIGDPNWNSISVTKEQPAHINITTYINARRQAVHLQVRGPFKTEEYGGTSIATFALYSISSRGNYEKVSDSWVVLLAATEIIQNEIVLEHDFILQNQGESNSKTYQLVISTNEKRNEVPLLVELSPTSKLSVLKITMAICVLIAFHILIIFELLPRTLASMIGAALAVSCLSLVSERPSLGQIVSWMDIEMLTLVFGLNLIISILCETGFFEFAAILAYKLAGGHFWTLFTGLCFLTTLLSISLDTLTAIIIMSALTIRLCEAMNIDPKNLLIALVIFANIGGAIGYSTFNLKGSSIIGFAHFTLHMFPAVLLSILAGFILWWLRFRDISILRFEDPLEVVEVKREQEVWKKAYHSLSNYSREEESVRAILKRKIAALETLLLKKLYDSKISTVDYKISLKELTHTMKEKNRYLLYKSGAVVISVIVFLLLRNIPQLNLSSGWIAVLGVLCILVLVDFDKLESVLGRVGWSTLLFLASLFVFTEALIRLDLVDYMVLETLNFIKNLDKSLQLLVSLVIVIWISALSSTLVIPFSAVMIELIRDNDRDLNPLVFALTLGTCLGGNGSLFGGSANVVSAGIAEQHGYRFSYSDFFKIGFPTMMLTTALSMAYLLICHVWIGWND